MNRFPILCSVLSATVLAFAGCLSGTGTSTEQQPTGLYRCIGESAYAPGELEEIMREIKAQNLECADHGSVAVAVRPEQVVPVSGDAARPVDSMLIRAVVLDERCDLVSDKEKMVPSRNHQGYFLDAWDMSRDDGTPAETGVYYVNIASVRPDGSQDTAYVKVGMVSDPCGR
jgi:hypothetical protein